MPVVPSSPFLVLLSWLQISAQVAIHRDVGLFSVPAETWGSFPARREGASSFCSLYTKAANWGFCMGWEVIKRVDHGVTLKENPEAAAPGSPQTGTLGRQRLNSPWGIIQSMASPHQSILRG